MHAGLLEAAQHGTIFLDEITEMSSALQGKLLRFMQNGEVRRLGGHEARHVGVRVVARQTGMSTRRPGPAGSGPISSSARRPPSGAAASGAQGGPPAAYRMVLKKWDIHGPHLGRGDGIAHVYDWPGNVRELETSFGRRCFSRPFTVILPENLPGSCAPS